MGKRGESICFSCKVASSCSDHAENQRLSEDGFCIHIVECEKFKK